MYYLIEVQGKQYKVKQGDYITVDNLNLEKGSKVVFDKVLAVVEDKGIEFGQPYVKGKKVEGIVEENFKGEKIVVFKYRHKVNWRRKYGFRPHLTKVKITSLS
ncbi:MAG: 50S ribosomal protein L21 [Spirochaetia bacterium]|nr:50S ribosomal protein L21 [Spirochaetota bacterium]MCX8096030.1 50S ribosomal protein L21 [Spirochaetota bacterium]MDW8111825.1 50S ribosomal protein L21 [Spirochaetia bacterium]